MESFVISFLYYYSLLLGGCKEQVTVGRNNFFNFSFSIFIFYISLSLLVNSFSDGI